MNDTFPTQELDKTAVSPSSSSLPIIGIALDYCIPGGYSARSAWYALRTEYASAIHHQGGCPILLPYAMDLIDRYISLCDGILIPGGNFDPDPALYGQTHHASVTLNPERTRFEYALLQKALNAQMPILGICGGMQLLNVVRGGSLIQDIPSMCPEATEHRSLDLFPLPTHPVQIQPESLLHRITNTLECHVNTSHHQAVDRLGAGLVASAHTPDGVIEAIEDPTMAFCLGTQWHPEYEALEMEQHVLRAFVQAAAQHHNKAI